MIYAIFIIYHFFTGLWQNVATIWGKYIVFPPISFSMSVTHFHMSTTTVIYLFIHSAACSSYACCRRESYINKCKTKLLLMQNSIFLPYLLSLNRDLCVTISSVWVHKWVQMLTYFTLGSLIFLVISISIFNVLKNFLTYLVLFGGNFPLPKILDSPYICEWHLQCTLKIQSQTV